MGNLCEIEKALEALNSVGVSKDDITVLHATTMYPTSMKDVNVNAMLTIKDAFKVDVGYSDHTLGIEVPIAAVALGAKVIEKHFTLEKSMHGPDHKASLEPSELKAMVQAIRNIELALGDGVKKPTKDELKNKKVVQKSIVAKRDIKKGEKFSSDNLTLKRTSKKGLEPYRWDEIVGTVAQKDYSEDELI
jgi:N,N'-diacetyllegionaminate synthase